MATQVPVSWLCSRMGLLMCDMSQSDGKAESIIPSTWQFWRSGLASGVRNMAIDSALLDLASARSVGVFRCYGWTEPTITIGRNEVATDRFDLDFLSGHRVGLVRRATGGRALFHSREIAYSATFRLSRQAGWQQGYNAVNALLQSALVSLGIEATIVSASARCAVDGRSPSARTDVTRSSICFSSPNQGELTVLGHKLVGSAVWRTRDAFLQQGSILIHDDQNFLARASRDAVPEAPGAAGLASLLGAELSDAQITSMVENAIELACRESSFGRVTPLVTDASFLQMVEMHKSTFQSREWLWRR